MTARAYVVADVFTDVPLQGNQLAVFTDADGLTDEQMQRTARELNLSETVFLLPGEDGADARMRIFTPVTELPFAGHPVLGTAFVVGRTRNVRLQTESGVIAVELDDQRKYGEMTQPLPEMEPFEAQDELLRAIGVTESLLPIEAWRNGPLHVYVAVKDTAALRPDLTALAELGAVGVNCFTELEPRRVQTRMFGPGLGVPEDPATGSAAGPLALHLVRHGRLAAGEQLEIRQGEQIGRPSTLYARVEETLLVVGGSAVIVARGEYQLA